MPYPIAKCPFNYARLYSYADIATYRDEIGVPRDAYLCGRVGSPHDAKWHKGLLAAFQCVADRDPRAFLLVVGAPPGILDAVRRMPLAVRKRVKVRDPVSSDAVLSRVYSSLDCFVHWARIGESFGYVLAEAMSCGCPVVTVSQPLRDNSQVEVVGHLDGGVVGGGGTAFCAAVVHLWSDPNLRTQLAARVRSRIVQRYDTGIVAAKALRIAAIACATPNRTALAEKLQADPEMQSTVSDQSIVNACSNTFGGCDSATLRLAFLLNGEIPNRAHTFVRRWHHNNEQ